MICLPTGSGGERQLPLLPRAPHQLLQSHRASPYRIRGGAPAAAPPPGPPTSSCNLTVLLLTGSGGERQLPLLPRAPPPALAISPCFSLPDPGGSAGCRSSPGPPHQLV